MDKYTIVMAVMILLAGPARLLREDVKWFPTLRQPWRGVVVGAVAMIVTPSLETVLADQPIVPALIAGVVSFLPTLLSLIAGLTASKTKVLS